MTVEIKNCLEIVENSIKLKIKEFDALLLDGSREARIKFLNGYLRYIFSITYKIYTQNSDDFNAYFSFEDFFQSAIELAGDYFDKPIFREKRNNLFQMFNKFYSLEVQRLLRYAYFVKVSYVPYCEIRKIEKYVEQYQKLNDRMPSKEELRSVITHSKFWKKEIYQCDSLDSCKLYDDTFEDRIIEEIMRVNLHKELVKGLKVLDDVEKAFVCRVNGFDVDDNYLMPEKKIDLARECHISPQTLDYKIKGAYKKIYKNNTNLKEYHS